MAGSTRETHSELARDDLVRRKRIALAIKATPSLEPVIRDPDWQEDMWLDALAQSQGHGP